MAGPSQPTVPQGSRAPRRAGDALGPEIRAYRVLTRLAKPAAGLILRAREKRGKEDPARRPERLGVASLVRPPGPMIWMHAASVGEANAVLPLIEAVGARRPGIGVLLTTGTVTSARAVATRLPPFACHQYVPLDVPQFVGRFLDYWRPALGVFTEQEIWPNLIVESRARSIPLMLVNARMSERSFRGWQRRPRLAAALLGGFATVLAQNETYAARFTMLGATGVHMAGNLKIDAPPPPVDAAALAQLETALAGRPRLVAASTHEGEETLLVAAHRELARRIPGFCTIIAPRHPERGAAIAAAISSGGLMVGRRGAGAFPTPATDIYIADTIGELGTLYAIAPVAFVGGSLIPWGGQNPIEAVRHGAVVLSGPNVWNFEDAYQALFAAEGALKVGSAAEIADAVASLIDDPAMLARRRQGAETALAGLGGALQRTVGALLPLIADTGALASAS